MRSGCGGCHELRADTATTSTVRAPPLAGLYGSAVPLSDGTVVIADERYLHDSIVRPDLQIAAGYAPIMPSFAGQLDEVQLLQLVAYIKTLAPERPQ